MSDSRSVGTAEDRIRILRPHPEADLLQEMADDVRRGLTGERKELPPKYFYDARGSRLFERITRLPEYYLTRTERGILLRLAPELVRELRPRALVEFGAGSAEKTRILLDAMAREGLLEGYAPIDVSAEALEETARRLAAAYPELRIVGVIGDFQRRLALPFRGEGRLVAFLGSTIGNFTGREATSFLRRVAEGLLPGDGFLVGFDLVKDPARLEAAYDDAAGVTARFNRNALRVLNRELGADFDLSAFRHRAVYEEEEARIEMYLVSAREQEVRFQEIDLVVRFREGEAIRTELSHKYTRESAEGLLEAGRLQLARWETDPEGSFAVALARREEER